MKINARPLLILVLSAHLFFPIPSQADIPNSPSYVYAKNTRLVVERRLDDGSLDSPRPYVIKGVTWSPATRAPDKGPDPFNPEEEVPYGFFFDWEKRSPAGYVVFDYWLKNQYLEYYLQDISLMKEMGVNTVRIYNDFGDDKDIYDKILNEFYRNGIMVIMTAALSKDDIDKKRYKRVVDNCKEHPAVLMWSIGNEWNLEYNKYWGYSTVGQAAAATDRLAREIKKIDSRHPVSSCLGDRFYDDKKKNTVAWIVRRCPNVDIWGLNIYRGKNFANLFVQWRSITDKPMYLSEFGIDSFHTKNFKKVDDFQADDCTGTEGQKMQAEYAVSLWGDISKNLSKKDPAKVCAGGTIHTFNDCLWKVGSYHVNLGGLVDYSDPVEGLSYNRYDTEGYYIPGFSPDGVANEEYFGLVTADRKPKEAFWAVRDFYNK